MQRLCPCTTPTVLGPSIADCSQSQCGAGARCVNRKSRDLEDVSTGRPAASSSHVVVGEVFDGRDRLKDQCLPYDESLRGKYIQNAAGSLAGPCTSVSTENPLSCCLRGCRDEERCQAIMVAQYPEDHGDIEKAGKYECWYKQRHRPSSVNMGYFDSYVRANQWVLTST